MFHEHVIECRQRLHIALVPSVFDQMLNIMVGGALVTVRRKKYE
jgi:hypothetical protein